MNTTPQTAAQGNENRAELFRPGAVVVHKKLGALKLIRSYVEGRVIWWKARTADRRKVEVKQASFARLATEGGR